MDVYTVTSSNVTECVVSSSHSFLAFVLTSFHPVSLHASPRPTPSQTHSTIKNTFAQINSTLYGSYDARTLNESTAEVQNLAAGGLPATPGYIFATLIANNSVGADDGQGQGPEDSSGVSGSGSGGGGGPNTSLAM